VYNFDVSENLEKILNKLSKKDKDLYNQILKKLMKLYILRLLDITRILDTT